MACADVRKPLALAIVVLAATFAPALALQRVHVTALAVRVDRTHVRLGEQFHLYVHAHVRESVARLDGVTLPDLAEFNSVADERQYAAERDGTDYRETLTLAPLREGRFTLGNVVFDVYDPQLKRAMRYSSTDMITIVVGPSAPPDPWIAVRGFALALARAAGIAIALILAIAGAALILARRRPTPPPAPPPAQAVVIPPPDDLTEVLARLRADHNRANALAARAYLWRRAGAPEGATLSQVLSMNGTLDQGMRTALTAAERAAFIEPARMETAIDELIERLDRLT